MVDFDLAIDSRAKFYLTVTDKHKLLEGVCHNKKIFA